MDEEYSVRRFFRAATVAGLSALMSGVWGIGTGTAHAGPGGDAAPRIVEATVITDVKPDGYKVTGLAVRYDRDVASQRLRIDPAAFAAQATLTKPGGEAVSGARTITAAYTNSTADFSGSPRRGRFVVLHLDEADPLARSAYGDGSFSRLYDLQGAYRVTQVGDIRVGQRIVVPARPGSPVVNRKVHNRIVDEYASGSFVAASGVGLPYRSFSPDVQRGKRYPLVVTLHGYGESGDNNLSQIAGNQISVAFADPARQAKHPAYVLSPQANPLASTSGAWWNPRMQAAVVELVKDFVAGHPAVDTSRVYLTGLSMGSYGSWGLLPADKGLFAGALLVTGAGNEPAAVASLGDFPIWAVHSVDDSIVAYDAPNSDYRIFKALEAAGRPVTWSEWSGLLPDAQQEAAAWRARRQAARAGSVHIFTTLPAGTTPLFDHGSWIPTYTNDVMLDWLFDQRQSRRPGSH
jgi:predicted peptidase